MEGVHFWHVITDSFLKKYCSSLFWPSYRKVMLTQLIFLQSLNFT